jgi:hypothetical protein
MRDTRSENLLSYAQDDFAACEEWSESAHRAQAARYDLYRGCYTGNFHPYRNNVHYPLLFSICQKAAAQKTMAMYGGPLIAEMRGTGPEDAARARTQTIVLNAQARAAHVRLKGYDQVHSATLQGVGVMQVGWKWSSHTRSFVVREGELGQPERLAVKRQTFVEDRPDITFVDNLDFWPQPGAIRIVDGDMKRCWRRYWIEREQVEELAEAGYFDKEAIAELARTNTQVPDYGDGRGIRRGRLMRGVILHDGRKLVDPVECLDFWNTEMPKALRPKGGSKFRVVTLLNRAVIGRDREFPHVGGLPFTKAAPLEDTADFWSPGLVEIGERLQILKDRWGSNAADIMDLYADPMWIYNEGAGLDVRKLYSRTGHHIPVSNAELGLDQVLRQISPDLRGLQMLYPAGDELWNEMQRGTGQREESMGGAISKRQSAREYLGRQDAGADRARLEMFLLEEQTVQPMMTMFRDLDRQFLTKTQEFRIAGTAAFRDPTTGQTVPPVASADAWDMMDDFDLVPVASSRISGLDAQRAQATMVFQAMAGLPMLAERINPDAALRMLVGSIEGANVDDLIVQDEEQIQLNRMALMAQKGGGQRVAAQAEIR